MSQISKGSSKNHVIGGRGGQAILDFDHGVIDGNFPLKEFIHNEVNPMTDFFHLWVK